MTQIYEKKTFSVVLGFESASGEFLKAEEKLKEGSIPDKCPSNYNLRRRYQNSSVTACLSTMTKIHVFMIAGINSALKTKVSAEIFKASNMEVPKRPG